MNCDVTFSTASAYRFAFPLRPAATSFSESDKTSLKWSAIWLRRNAQTVFYFSSEYRFFVALNFESIFLLVCAPLAHQLSKSKKILAPGVFLYAKSNEIIANASRQRLTWLLVIESWEKYGFSYFSTLARGCRTPACLFSKSTCNFTYDNAES